VNTPFLIYGATGFTGELIARLAVGGGLKPTLAGRTRDAVVRIASELGLEYRRFALDDSPAVEEGLSGMKAVLHCAGPFVRTFQRLSDACLKTGVHYLDVTGEIGVFEALAARDGEAKKAGVMLLPGVGFDVVPSDCLALHLKRRLPSATHLSLGFQSSGRLSRGTLTTTVENLPRGGFVRRDGVITSVPAAWKTRRIDFGRGERKAITIPWGDIATAFHSTGIPNIDVFLAAPLALRVALRASRLVRPLLGRPLLQGFLLGRVRRLPPGPSVEERAGGRCYLWGEAHDAAARVVARLQTPEAYALTAETALAACRKVLAGEAPVGFQTPAMAYGPDFVLEVPGVIRTDAA
jgi:short subunit dehydrogenase-like uncharacterized protein